MVNHTTQSIQQATAEAVSDIRRDLPRKSKQTFADWVARHGPCASAGVVAALKDIKNRETLDHVRRYRLTNFNDVYVWYEASVSWSCAPEICEAPGTTHPPESDWWNGKMVRVYLTAWWAVALHVVKQLEAEGAI